MTRSTRLLTVGVAVIVVSLAVAVLALRGAGTEPITVAESADGPVAAAGTGEPTADAAPEATRAVGSLGDDEQRLATPIELPEGHEAVAVSVGYDAAVGALPSPGDRVNVYGVFTSGLPEQFLTSAQKAAFEDDPSANPLPQQGVVRAFSGVEVLGLSGATSEQGGGSVTLVLALEPDAAERVVYLHTIEQLFFSLVAEDDEPVTGQGRLRDDVLEGLDVELAS